MKKQRKIKGQEVIHAPHNLGVCDYCGYFKPKEETPSPKSRSEVGEEIIAERIRLQERQRIEKWIKQNQYCAKCSSPKKYCAEWNDGASSVDTDDLLTFLSNPK